ncbi:Nnf1-domain-containing protein [Limtongia smithiae]|uniref:Nnf1-domain-containing protein n=1 Tax=Limtongia smithiae TaxID=1125753 RepID=UPI0034CFE685
MSSTVAAASTASAAATATTEAATALSQSAERPAQPAEHRSIRNDRLTDVFNRSLQSSTKALTFDKLAQCYPYVAEHGRLGLREAMNQAMRFWETSATREYNAILRERNVRQKLDELDVLIDEARARKRRHAEEMAKDDNPSPDDHASDHANDTAAGAEKQVFIETLSPEDIVRAHLTPLNLAEAEKLERRIQESQAANKELLNELTAQEVEIEALFCGISKALNELESAKAETAALPTQMQMFATVDEIRAYMRR